MTRHPLLRGLVMAVLHPFLLGLLDLFTPPLQQSFFLLLLSC